MATITLSGNDYFSYASVSDADLYLVPDINFATWSALTADAKGAKLIQATRLIDSLSYKENADTQSERELLPAFSDATILIASYVASGGTAILGASVAEAEAKRYRAGSVELENFRSNAFYFPSAYSDWPKNILALLKPYLQTTANALGISVFGTCGKTPIDNYEILDD